ncbi:DciA family protein [Sporolituus thermophilus]|uniref:DUF721 domain-containing protein n=1 Tax=Sporolituus thermophilus DSM 23256 TaxID=1123285 RepID=A0A1G7LX73_9FIRM|nr:DUF721 domain-containing protein [Sporolituus thermophilus]SDF53996.1 Protein of unknown function [Sporolituus thermophilus DSM 23256]
MIRLGETIGPTLEKLGLAKKFKAQSVIYHWREIVGDDIAAHARPAAVERGTLILVVTSSVWSHHLSTMKQVLLDKINAFLGDKVIVAIRFQAGYFKDCPNYDENGEIQEEPPLAYKLRAIRLEADEVKKAQEMVTAIADEQLRSCLLRLLLKDFAYTKLKRLSGWRPCAGCGVLCRPEHKYCVACGIAEKDRRQREITGILQEAPWLTYTELKEYFPCSAYEYYQAKKHLINKLLANVKSGQADKLTAATVVMLATGQRPQDLDQGMIAREIEKIGRNQYVFTPGG